MSWSRTWAEYATQKVEYFPSNFPFKLEFWPEEFSPAILRPTISEKFYSVFVIFSRLNRRVVDSEFRHVGRQNFRMRSFHSFIGTPGEAFKKF